MRSYKYAKLQICEVTNMRSYKYAKLQICEVTNMRSCKDTKLQRYEVAKIRSYDAKFYLNFATSHRNFAASLRVFYFAS